MSIARRGVGEGGRGLAYERARKGMKGERRLIWAWSKLLLIPKVNIQMYVCFLTWSPLKNFLRDLLLIGVFLILFNCT